ncbi:MAG: hypothetical protein ACXWUG_00785 [Polyangiales bacterium]
MKLICLCALFGAAGTAQVVQADARTPQPLAMNTAASADQPPLMDFDHPGRPNLRPGVAVNLFGAGGSKDEAAWGLGGRLEYVTPFGMSVGASYQHSFNRTTDKRSVRPLLGEIGMAIAVARVVELRPLVGLGYAFVTNDTGPVSTTTGQRAVSAGLDIAPGAKISFLPGNEAAAFELYTLPKLHFIDGSNFYGMELGAGARF